MDTQTLKRWIAFFGWWLAIFTVCMVIALSVGCTYTAPSVSEPDLIERVTNGHKVCYYKTGRGYAKCCEDCPMHNETVGGGK